MKLKDNYTFDYDEGDLKEQFKKGFQAGQKQTLEMVKKLLKNKDYMVCKFCNVIAYGDGNCHCGKSFKTDDNWIFCYSLFEEELKKNLGIK